MNEYNILIIGVGGQGVLKLAQMICEVAIIEGKNALMSEIHGMAQRGGSVFSEIRIGDVLGSIIEDGETDLLISLEPSEILRYLDKLKKEVIIISNNEIIKPYTVSLGVSTYPDVDKTFEKLKEITKNIYIIDGNRLAKEVGSNIILNTIMFGFYSGINPLNFKEDSFKKVIYDNFKGPFYDINEKAFELGKKEFLKIC
ncbi:MAG: indolepyruvate oxidoreductase subunit beta [Caldisericia bacterium]